MLYLAKSTCIRLHFPTAVGFFVLPTLTDLDISDTSGLCATIRGYPITAQTLEDQGEIVG